MKKLARGLVFALLSSGVFAVEETAGGAAAGARSAADGRRGHEQRHTGHSWCIGGRRGRRGRQGFIHDAPLMCRSQTASLVFLVHVVPDA